MQGFSNEIVATIFSRDAMDNVKAESFVQKYKSLNYD